MPHFAKQTPSIFQNPRVENTPHPPNARQRKRSELSALALASYQDCLQACNPANAKLAACRVAATSPSLWDVETNAASNCEGGK